MRKLSEIKDLTIDVGILMIGCKIGNPDPLGTCRSLMDKALDSRQWFLALDKGRIIRQQYETKLKRSAYWLYWMAEMAKRDKIRPVAWGTIDRGVITKLKEEHFDWEDLKYVKTAAVTECKILVTLDPGYSTNVCRALKKKLKVKVKNSKQCLCLA